MSNGQIHDVLLFDNAYQHLDKTLKAYLQADLSTTPRAAQMVPFSICPSSIFSSFPILLFPSVAFAAKPEDPTVRVGATFFMVLLVAVIAAVWKIIRSKLSGRNTKSNHNGYMRQQSIAARSKSTADSRSIRLTVPERIETPPNDPQQQASRSALSLEKAVLGHWVCYIDFRTSYEKLRRSKHYVTTHWYIDENNLKIIQIENRAAEEVPKEARTFVYKILETNDKKSMIRIEMFDHPQKVSYSQATLKFSHDRRKMVHETILPKTGLSPSEWIYVDPIQSI